MRSIPQGFYIAYYPPEIRTTASSFCLGVLRIRGPKVLVFYSFFIRARLPLLKAGSRSSGICHIRQPLHGGAQIVRGKLRVLTGDQRAPVPQNLVYEHV